MMGSNCRRKNINLCHLPTLAVNTGLLLFFSVIVFVGCGSSSEQQKPEELDHGSEGGDDSALPSDDSSKVIDTDFMDTSNGNDNDKDSEFDVDTKDDEDTDIPGPSLVEGCKGQLLREKPEDLNDEGPWPVGAVTTKIDNLTVEVWYPGEPGSQIGHEKVTYDIREYLPSPDKVTDEENPLQYCNCYRDLPLDREAGPYPVVVYVHGTAGLRTQNLEQMTHFASRGFVVLATDHPNINFRDLVKNPLGSLQANQTQDARKIFKALENLNDDLAFLEGHIDTSRQGIMGHSAGASAIRGMGDIVQVIISYAGSGGVTTPVDSVLFIAGSEDTVGGTVKGYDNAAPIKRAVLVEGGGHLVGSSLCVLRDPQDPSRDLLDILQEKNIGGLVISMARGMFQGCNETADDDNGEYINELDGIEIFNFATVGVLEETLQCSNDAAEKLSKIGEAFDGHIASYQQQLQ